MTTQPKLASGSWRRFAHFSTRWLSFLILLLAAALALFANGAPTCSAMPRSRSRNRAARSGTTGSRRMMFLSQKRCRGGLSGW